MASLFDKRAPRPDIAHVGMGDKGATGLMPAQDRFINLILQYPLWMLTINAALVAVIAIGASRLQVETGIDIFFADDDPNLLAQRSLDETYGREDNILFIVEAVNGDIFTPENLISLVALTLEAWQMPNSRRVDSVTNYLYPTVDGDDIIIAPLLDKAAQLDTAKISGIRDLALSEDALVGRLLSSDAAVTGVNVSLNLNLREKAGEVDESVSFARQLAAQIENSNSNLRVYLAGWAVTEQTLAEVTTEDSSLLIPVLFVVVLVLLAFLLRSPFASLCTVIVILLSIAVGMGFAGWAGVGLNSVNVSAPTIIMTLAVADCVHIFSAFLRQLREGMPKRRALEYGLRDTLYPIALTSVTTALGFLSMNFSDSPPFAQLGNVAAVGVLGALWASVTILPGLILLLPFRTKEGVSTGLPMDGLARFVLSHQAWLRWGFTASIVIIVSFIPRIDLNDDPSGYFSEAIPLYHAINMIDSRLSGSQSIHYSIEAIDGESISDPDYLEQVAKFVNWLREQPEVTNVESFTDTLKRLNQVMHDNSQEWFRLPDSNEMASQYVLLYEISVPYGQDVTHQINASKSALKISATVTNQQSSGLIAFEERTRLWLEENTPDIASRGTGQSLSFANIGLRNIHSMLYGSLVAIILISICLIIAFRSIKFGIVSLIPNLFPAFVTLGLWSIFVGEVNIAASVVFSITLGIIVDDTTHFLVRYRQARLIHSLSAEDAIRYTFNSVGGALVTTSVALAAGFFVLVASDFSVNSTSGLLVALTIFMAILLDLLWLPTLLIKADRWLVQRKPDQDQLEAPV
ncbi:MAG: MMPL family transporter [Pseudomonadota bacterium]